MEIFDKIGEFSAFEFQKITCITNYYNSLPVQNGVFHKGVVKVTDENGHESFVPDNHKHLGLKTFITLYWDDRNFDVDENGVLTMKQ